MPHGYINIYGNRCRGASRSAHYICVADTLICAQHIHHCGFQPQLVTHSLVLSFSGKAATDVTLLLVLIQHRFHLQIKPRRALLQPLGNILMYRRFADLKDLCHRSDGGPGFYYIFT